MDTRLTFNSLFDREERALNVHETRANILSKNIANASTPNYKAQDLDFREALKESFASSNASLNKTHPNHMALNSSQGHYRISQRPQVLPSEDGNTVDDNIERTNFIENAIRYQASLAFTKSKAASLIKAIKGE